MIIVAILAVSIDAYVAGLSIGYGRAGELKILYIAAFSFVLPLLFITAIRDGEWLNKAAACILIILGLKGLYDRENKATLLTVSQRKMGVAEATMLGISLSIDSVFGSALFSGEYNVLTMCAAVFCAQYIMLTLGRLTLRLRTGVKIFSPIASLVLILIGISRLF